MPEAMVSRILRVPGYGVYACEAEETTGRLWLWVRQTAREPYYVCGGGGTPVRGVHTWTERRGREPPRGTGRGGAVAVGAADGPGTVLRVWRVRDLGPGRPQLDGAADPRSAVGHVAGVAGDRGPSRTVSALRRAHRAAAVRDAQGPLHNASGGGGGARL